MNARRPKWPIVVGAVVLLWLLAYLVGIDIGKSIGRNWFD